MSNSDLKRKWVDDVTSSNSQPSIQQPMPPGVGNEFSESVGGEKELEPEMDVDPPENREIPLLSVDSANSAAIVSNPDKQTAKDIQTDETEHATECDRDGVCDEPKTEQSHDYGAEFGSKDVEMQIESHQSVENGGKSSVNVEQPEHHDDPLPRVDSADPSTSISKPDEETKPEKAAIANDIHTSELILDPDYARGGNSDEQTTEQLDVHELSEDTGSDSEDVDDELDAKSEKSAKEGSDGKEPSVIDISSDSDDDENVPDSDDDENDSSEEDSDEESLVDLAIVPDKETNPEKDTLSVEDIDNNLLHGELIGRIMNSKNALNCPAFIALKAKKERRLLKVEVKSNGTVKLELAKINRGIGNTHYVNLKTCMVLLMTKNDWYDFGIQLVSLIRILLHGYDASEACFHFETLGFEDCHSLPFKKYFKASPDKFNIKSLQMNKNKVLAPLLQFVHPKCLHIGFPSASLLDSDGKLMISDIDKLHLNSDIEDTVDRVIEQCQAGEIHLSRNSVWTDDSIKRVLKVHVKNVSAKSRSIHGNSSKGERLQLRSRTQWKTLEDNWVLSCAKARPMISNFASVHFEIPTANTLDASYRIDLYLSPPFSMTI